MFICVNAERARIAASRINKGMHDHLTIDMADDLFAAHPALMGRHLESLTIRNIDGQKRPRLTLSGYEFVPTEIIGAAIPHPAMAPGMAFELLTLAYSVILRNRAREHVKSASAYLLESGEKITLQHDFIRSCASRHKWPKTLSQAAMRQLRAMIDEHADEAFDPRLPGTRRSMAMSRARLAAAYAVWAGCNGITPRPREEN